MVETKTILVSGVTGQQGSAVARSLNTRGHRVRGLTRNPDRMKELEARGIEPVRGDLTDPSSLARALRGVYGFFVVTTPFGPNFSVDVETEVRQGTTAIAAASAARVPHLVLASVASADRNTGIPHFESKAQIERHLGGSGLPHTVTRPVAFMDTYAGWWMGAAVQSGTLALGLPQEYRLQMVAVKDIGEIVARAFGSPERAVGRTVEIAGDAVSMGELARMFSEKLGRSIRYVELPDEEVLKTMGEDGARMLRWFRDEGFHVDIPALESEWGHPMTRFDEFLRTAKFDG